MSGTFKILKIKILTVDTPSNACEMYTNSDSHAHSNLKLNLNSFIMSDQPEGADDTAAMMHLKPAST